MNWKFDIEAKIKEVGYQKVCQEVSQYVVKANMRDRLLDNLTFVNFYKLMRVFFPEDFVETDLIDIRKYIEIHEPVNRDIWETLQSKYLYRYSTKEIAKELDMTSAGVMWSLGKPFEQYKLKIVVKLYEKSIVSLEDIDKLTKKLKNFLTN